MSKPTKIDLIRHELTRIASLNDRQDRIVPTMRASWSFSKVVVLGKIQMQSFDFDALLFLLRKIPSEAGEHFFWHAVRNTDFVEIGNIVNHGCPVVQLSEYQNQAKVHA